MRLALGAIVLGACTPAAEPTPRPTDTTPRARPVVSTQRPPSGGTPSSPATPSAAASIARPASRIRETPRRASETRCVQPLATFCAPPACPTWDAALAETMKSAEAEYTSEGCSGLGAGDVAIGTCGPYRFVEDGDCLSGLTRYFDARGTLVGVYAWSDVKKPCGSSTAYGAVPKCP